MSSSLIHLYLQSCYLLNLRQVSQDIKYREQNYQHSASWAKVLTLRLNVVYCPIPREMEFLCISFLSLNSIQVLTWALDTVITYSLYFTSRQKFNLSHYNVV